MDIKSGNGYPSSALSNFAPHPFIFDGVECNSMEGLLQSFKFEQEHIQVEVCKFVGFAAKKRGKPRNNRWQSLQTLWWKNKEFLRHSKDYQDLLDCAYLALATNSSFRKALLASGDSNITHSIGHNDSSKTVLTEKEFCSRLMWLREIIKKEENARQNS